MICNEEQKFFGHLQNESKKIIIFNSLTSKNEDFLILISIKN